MNLTVRTFPLLVALCLLLGCGSKSENPQAAPPVKVEPPQLKGRVTFAADSPKLAEIKVETVASASVPAGEVVSPGKVEANPNRLSHVVIPVAGRITQVRVRLGDSVKQGDPVIEIESPDIDQALSTHLQAVAGINQAKAGLSKAQADFERTKDLFEHNAIAKRELLNAETLLRQAEATLQQAEAVTRQALRRLEILGIKPGEFGQRLTVRAPMSGKILELTVAAGEYRNDTNASLMTIADLSSVWVSSDVQETYIRMVQMGERVEIELSAYPGEKFRGRVTQIADMVDPTTRTVKVRAQMENPKGRLRPEMFARIRVLDDMVTKPVVPASAIIQGDGQNVVFREISKGVFQQTAVTLGGRSGDKIAVLSGLDKGDRVAVDGVMLLKAN